MQLSFVEGRNRMKLCNKISKGVAKGAEVICMLTIAALVLVIVVELLRRNFLGQSFGGNVQLCGILFLWMAFIGLIPLYRDSGLMRLDFLVARTKGPVYEVLYFANKLFSTSAPPYGESSGRTRTRWTPSRRCCPPGPSPERLSSGPAS